MWIRKGGLGSDIVTKIFLFTKKYFQEKKRKIGKGKGGGFADVDNN